MARIDVTRAAKLVAVAGASGSGKSAWVKKQIARRARVIVWDPDHEYPGIRCTTPRELLKAINTRKRGRICFTSSPKHFDYWARCAFAWGNCVAVGEELADVTHPGKAPPGWGQLVRRGRKRGITVIGISQRPAEADKTLLGNATLIHCGRLRRENDRRVMAAEMDVSLADVSNLAPLEWIESNEKGDIRRGKLKF
ncbi:MAG: type IV secretory system conjugative DNA transfer family protein [Gammaproteobacteria bacterium]|nr:type IV secretory system conjugative DNA transfer family protein [Gammaproteobacteria bacterium]